MSRNLAELKAECKAHNLTVKQSGKREAKSDYESALREFYWQRDHAGELMVEQMAPMLARNAKDLPEAEVAEMERDGNRWVSQEKINGCRMFLHIRNPKQGRGNWCTSRRLSDETYRFNELHDQMPHYRDLYLGDEWEGTVVDGEILMPVAVVDTTVFDGDGTVTADILQATAATMNCGAEKSVAIQERFGKLTLHAFDCTRFQGKDIRQLPYEQRYVYLQQVVARFTEVMGEMPCQHCQGIRSVPRDVEPLPAALPDPPCVQESFDDIMNQ